MTPPRSNSPIRGGTYPSDDLHRTSSPSWLREFVGRMEPERRSRTQGRHGGGVCAPMRMGSSLRGSVAAKAGRGETGANSSPWHARSWRRGWASGGGGQDPTARACAYEVRPRCRPIVRFANEAQPFWSLPSGVFSFSSRCLVFSTRRARASVLQTHTHLDGPRRRVVPCSRAVPAARSTPRLGAGDGAGLRGIHDC